MSTPTLSSSRAAIALSALVLVSCGRPAEDVPMKHAGVGLNPDEIGPLPEERGGLIEVDHIDYSSGRTCRQIWHAISPKPKDR